MLDTTIASVALHTLASQFHVGVSSVQWVTTGYLLALAVTIPVSGWATSRFGDKPLRDIETSAGVHLPAATSPTGLC